MLMDLFKSPGEREGMRELLFTQGPSKTEFNGNAAKGLPGPWRAPGRALRKEAPEVPN